MPGPWRGTWTRLTWAVTVSRSPVWPSLPGQPGRPSGPACVTPAGSRSVSHPRKVKTVGSDETIFLVGLKRKLGNGKALYFPWSSQAANTYSGLCQWSQDFLVPNFLHLVRSYKQQEISFVEATCIKSYLLHQNPDSVYFHTNLGSLKTLGKYWDQLYQGEHIFFSLISLI